MPATAKLPELLAGGFLRVRIMVGFQALWEVNIRWANTDYVSNGYDVL